MFKKYSSIENHYQNKYIEKMLRTCPAAEQEIWIAREKLDGSNIQLYFQPNQEMLVGKRSCFISRDENFNDIWNVLEKYKAELLAIQEYCNDQDLSIRMFGEIYGKGIQNRIDYGPDKYIKFFDMEIDNHLQSQQNFELHIEGLGIVHMLPKSFGVGYLRDLLQIDVEIDNCEGIVLKPYYSNFYNQHDRFIIKKKSSKFKDKENKETKSAEIKGDDPFYNLNQEFQKYVNENRVLDCFSKYGPIQDSSQIGTYINYILDDAKVDFLKDYNVLEQFPQLEKKQEKQIFNVGSKVALLLKNHL